MSHEGFNNKNMSYIRTIKKYIYNFNKVLYYGKMIT